jgi:hypothetical protein
MPAYDFSTLNDVDFEGCSLDLLSHELGVRIERFKTGKDGGIDGRFFSGDGGATIIQCKHYLRSGFLQLLAKLKSEEVLKAQKLNPKRYILATSLPLNPSDKQKILEAYNGIIKLPSDILGQDDLNALMGKFPEVELQHFKLWITSSAALTRFLNSAVYGRSRSEMEEVIASQKLFVETSSFKTASKILNKNKVIIITGEPGIGKTTLARQLWMNYVRDGFELFVVDSVKEAESVFKNDRKQLFFFDDFLGSNVLDAQKNNSSSAVVGFIKRIRINKDKVFILTSRSAIISANRPYINHYDSEHVRDDEYEYVVGDMLPYEKALMLYNHMLYWGLEPPFVDKICGDKFYRKIISHRNFNPRLISYMTQMRVIGEIQPERYCEWAFDMLEKPSKIWEDVFYHQIDKSMQLMAIIVFAHNGHTEECVLKDAYINLQKQGHITSDFPSIDTNEILKKCTGSILKRSILNTGKVEYDLFSPAISDYLIAEILDQSDLLSDVFLSMRSVWSVHALGDFIKANKISNTSLSELLVTLIRKECFVTDDNFSIALCGLILSMPSRLSKELISLSMSYAVKIIDGNISAGHFTDRIALIEQCKDYFSANGKGNAIRIYLLSVIDSISSYDECKDASELINDIDDDDVNEKFSEKCYEELGDCIEQMVIENSVIDDSCITEYEIYDGDYDIKANEGAAYAKVNQYIEEINNGINNCLDDSQLDNLAEMVNVSSILDDVISNYRRHGDDEGGHWGKSDGGDIDDLFSRFKE